MAHINYFDFDLLLEGAGGKYTARILNSPAGQADASFRLPFSELELENFYLKIGRPRRSVRRLDAPQRDAAKTFGEKLFKAVFAGEVLACWRSSLDQVESRGAGLRLRVRLNAPELVELPWEFLYLPALDRFLVLGVQTPIVRYLELPQRIRPLKIKPPLKILAMVASPADYAPLDVEQEWANLKSALAELEARKLVVLERLAAASLGELQRHLRRGEFHIFHFIGHGVFDEREQDGVLLMEDDMQRGRRVSGKYLGTLLHNHQPLRLAVLNACEGARASRTDPFSGTAQNLVRQGLPAVIAMQFEITDVAAVAFAREFYAAIADGYPVDAALAEARASIFAHGNEVEWGTPVLYMRAPDGRIFDLETIRPEDFTNPKIDAPPKKETPPSRPAQPPEVRPPALQPKPTPPQPARPPKPFWRNPMIVSLAILIVILFAVVLFKNVDWQPSKKTEPPRTSVKDSLYAVYRQQGENLFKQGKFAEAKSKFDAALKQKPGDAEITKQINLCNEKLAAQTTAAEREKLYVQYKIEGDAFWRQGKYEMAKLRYQDALTQKSGDEDATDKINACDQKIAEQVTAANRDKQFAQYRDAGDALFRQGKYQDAKNQYELARSYNRSDQHVQDRIQECNNRLLAAQKPKEEMPPPGMVSIRGGSFMMGSNDGDADEKPPHKVYVDDFFMDKYEVTVERYAQFLKENPSQTKPENWTEQQQNPNRPVVHVSWNDATAFCEWLSKQRGKRVRLPTEAEWEYAARGGLQGKKYPWGDDSPEGKANYGNSWGGDWASGPGKYLRNVDSYSANGYGLYNMAGNVWEWCADRYDENYYANSLERNPKGPNIGESRVLRGGGWYDDPVNLRAADRDRYNPINGDNDVGFRCLQDVR